MLSAFCRKNAMNLGISHRQRTICASYKGVLISPQPDQEGNRLQRRNVLSFIYPIYNHNWRNIITIYIYITRLASNEIFSPSNKIHREVGRAKDLSAKFEAAVPGTMSISRLLHKTLCFRESQPPGVRSRD